MTYRRYTNVTVTMRMMRQTVTDMSSAICVTFSSYRKPESAINKIRNVINLGNANISINQTSKVQNKLHYKKN